MADPPFPRAWWKSATVYQIFPHSFFDSNGDGIGDLNGIRAKLGYLQDLGVDVIWLCPIYRSPHADMGYDVSDYRDIDPRYGTMGDWHHLVHAIHARGMRILMDIVSNHTSDQHPWFLESKSSLNNPKRDWYIWRDPRIIEGVRHPPNNWRSVMQGSAWEFDEQTEQYYLHLFATQQPDLNWENAAVRTEMADVMRFWMVSGCDGLRLDAINAISKPNNVPDAPVTDFTQYFQLAPQLWTNRAEVHAYIQAIRAAVFAVAPNQNRMTVGETGFTFNTAQIEQYVLPARNEFNETFNFELMALDSLVPGNLLFNLPWGRTEIRDTVAKWQAHGRAAGFWNTVFMENHDFGRSITRFGQEAPQWRALSAKMLAVLQVTQTGTLYLYQGQEIGMKNFPRTWGIDEYKDVGTQRQWNTLKRLRQVETGQENPDMEDVLDDFRKSARDHARIPMQWNANANVGFTTGTPWMRAYQDDANTGWNVATERNDPDSVFSFWRRALIVRKQPENEVLIYGNFQLRLQADQRVIAYVRRLTNTTAWVVLNVTANDIVVPLAAGGLDIPVGVGVNPLPRLVLSNYNRPLGPQALLVENIQLQRYEARVYTRQD